MASSYAILRAKVDRIEGRKLYFSATLDSEDGTRLADASSLFIARKDQGDVKREPSRKQ